MKNTHTSSPMIMARPATAMATIAPMGIPPELIISIPVLAPGPSFWPEEKSGIFVELELLTSVWALKTLNISPSQNVPANPGWQEQLNPVKVAEQTPIFWHGWSSHWVISTNITIYLKGWGWKNLKVEKYYNIVMLTFLAGGASVAHVTDTCNSSRGGLSHFTAAMAATGLWHARGYYE